jgi:hypothetical protein
MLGSLHDLIAMAVPVLREIGIYKNYFVNSWAYNFFFPEFF